MSLLRLFSLYLASCTAGGAVGLPSGVLTLIQRDAKIARLPQSASGETKAEAELDESGEIKDMGSRQNQEDLASIDGHAFVSIDGRASTQHDKQADSEKAIVREHAEQTAPDQVTSNSPDENPLVGLTAEVDRILKMSAKAKGTSLLAVDRQHAEPKPLSVERAAVQIHKAEPLSPLYIFAMFALFVAVVFMAILVQNVAFMLKYADGKELRFRLEAEKEAADVGLMDVSGNAVQGAIHVPRLGVATKSAEPLPRVQMTYKRVETKPHMKLKTAQDGLKTVTDGLKKAENKMQHMVAFPASKEGVESL